MRVLEDVVNRLGQMPGVVMAGRFLFGGYNAQIVMERIVRGFIERVLMNEEKQGHPSEIKS